MADRREVKKMTVYQEKSRYVVHFNKKFADIKQDPEHKYGHAVLFAMLEDLFKK